MFYAQSKTITPASATAGKGTAARACEYLMDDHDTRRLEANANWEEIDYIQRAKPGHKTTLEGDKRLTLTGHGKLKGQTDRHAKKAFCRDCEPTHRDRLGRKTSARAGYKRVTLTVPKELSLVTETDRAKAHAAITRAIDDTLAKAYPGKQISAVSAIHTRNTSGEIHTHAHVLISKFAKDTETGLVRSLNSRFGAALGDTRDGERLRKIWTTEATKHLQNALNISIYEEKGKYTIRQRDTQIELEPLTRATRRAQEKALAPTVTYTDNRGRQRTRAFTLTKMDEKIYTIATKTGTWTREAHAAAHPKDAHRLEAFAKRVETLKRNGYLTPDTRPTPQFAEQAKIKFADEERKAQTQAQQQMAPLQEAIAKHRETRRGTSFETWDPAMLKDMEAKQRKMDTIRTMDDSKGAIGRLYGRLRAIERQLATPTTTERHRRHQEATRDRLATEMKRHGQAMFGKDAAIKLAKRHTKRALVRIAFGDGMAGMLANMAMNASMKQGQETKTEADRAITELFKMATKALANTLAPGLGKAIDLSQGLEKNLFGR